MTFSEFVNKFGKQFEDVRNILGFLSSYKLNFNPHIEEKTLIFSAEQLNNSQMDWLRVVSKMYHPHEINFFQPYWVPIQVDTYQFYIDLSDPNYPVFDTMFLSALPNGYVKIPYAKSASEIMIIANNDLNEKLLEYYEKSKQHSIDILLSLCPE